MSVFAVGSSVLVACGESDSSSSNGEASGPTGTGGSGGSAAGGATSAQGATTSVSTNVGGETGALPQLTVVGNQLQDSTGKTIVLRGSSLMDIGTLYAGAGNSIAGVTNRIDKVIAAGLSGHVVRLPVYPKIVYNGSWPFCSPLSYPVGTGPSATCTPSSPMTESEYMEKVLKPAVDYATGEGLYVIIDYHQIDDATTGTSAADANTFWTTVAPAFASYANVFYEAFNEPIDTTATWAQFKPVAQGLVDTIRAGAPNNIIIVPSPRWAQLPGSAASDPLIGANLMYTAHVYPGNWGAGFQEEVATATAKVPVFFTEWGYDLDSGNEVTNTTDANWGADFRAVLDTNGASWTAWVTDNAWMPRLFADATLTSLTDFGTCTQSWLADKANSDWVF